MSPNTSDSGSLLTTPQQRRPDIVRCDIVRHQETVSEATYLLRIPPQSPAFAGHFPGFPVLPGVVQLEWVKNLAQQLAPHGELYDLERVKFMRLMLPGAQVQLHISKQTAAGADKIEFRFFDEAGNFSSGRLVYYHAPS